MEKLKTIELLEEQIDCFKTVNGKSYCAGSKKKQMLNKKKQMLSFKTVNGKSYCAGKLFSQCMGDE